MKTFVYIDGFNLYYRLKNTPYKWLNLQKLISFLLNVNRHDVLKIKYFTALIKGNNNDQSNTTRQHKYLRALKMIPNLEIIYGQFKKRTVKGQHCRYVNGKIKEGKRIIIVKKWEEKESDVNIATHIVADAYKNEYDCAILISNDTDLKAPLEAIKNCEKMIGIISPVREIHKDLKLISNFQKRISNNILKKSQFPERLKDHKGEFYCPKEWIIDKKF